METNIVLLYSSKVNPEIIEKEIPKITDLFENYGANCYYKQFAFLPGQLQDWKTYSADLDYEKTYGVLVTTPEANDLVRGLSPYTTLPHVISVPSYNLDEQVMQAMVEIQNGSPAFTRNLYKTILENKN